MADSLNHTIRVIELPTGRVTTLAGTPGAPGSADGVGLVARFNAPEAIALDGAGSAFVADTGNNTIRRIDLATGVVTTLAGEAGVWGSADGTGSAARFDDPAGITVKGGIAFVTDGSNHTIRRVDMATRAVTTLAGSPGLAAVIDGVGSAARFHWPNGIVADDAGNLFVAESGGQVIRKVVAATGDVTIFAGTAEVSGSLDGVGTAAQFSNPRGIAIDGAGFLTVVDYWSSTIRRIEIATRTVSTLAGCASCLGYEDGVGNAAKFVWPIGVAADGAGHVYVADAGNHLIREIAIATREVGTFAGRAPIRTSVDGIGDAARFYFPKGLAADGAGNLFVADSGNGTIRKIAASSEEVTTIAGTAGAFGSTDGTGSTARFSAPLGIAADGSGNLFVNDRENHTIRQVVIATGAVSTLAGKAGEYGSADGIGDAARFYLPEDGIAADGAGNVYAADTWNHTIRKIDVVTASVTTLAGSAELLGSADGIGSSARFRYPEGLALDGAGNLYVADFFNHTIRKIVLATAQVTTLAGAAGSPGSADGTGNAARFYYPEWIAVSGGSLIVADNGNHTIRRVNCATGVVTTLAGEPGSPGDTDGTAGTARFWYPEGIARDAAGTVYVADGSACVRVGRPALSDAATSDAADGLLGVQRQLDTSPETATSWLWEQVGVPAGSTAVLSSTSIRNPTYTPDAPGLHVFRLTATDGSSTGITTASFRAWAPPTATLGGGGTICQWATSRIEAALTGRAPWSLTWSDGLVQEVTAGPATRDVSPSATTVYTVTSLSDANTSGSASGSATVNVNAAPATPTITAPSPVPAASTGNAASVTANPGSTFTWSITGGAITAGQGTNAIAFTAGRGGVLTLSVVEHGTNGCSSFPATIEIPMTAPLGSSFSTLPPCRLFDTRDSSGPAAAAPVLAAGETRSLSASGRCAVPGPARALSANVTVGAPTWDGHLTLYPSDLASPGNSTISFRAPRTHANNAVLELSLDGSLGLSVFNGSAGTVHLIVDVTGYFE